MAMIEPGAGELNRRVVIRERIDYPGAEPAEVGSDFNGVRRTWAKIEPVGSAVYSGSVQADSIVTHRVTIRYRNGITTGHEVVEKRGGVEVVYRVRRSSPLGTGRRFTVIEVEEL